MNNSRLKILFVTIDKPYPPSRGYSLMAYHHIRHLGKNNVVDLLTFSTDKRGEIAELHESCRRIEVVPFKRWVQLYKVVRALWTRLPFQVEYFHSQKMQHAVRRFCASESYDVVFFQMTRIAEYVKEVNAPAVLHMIDPLVLSYQRSMNWRPWYIRPVFKEEGRRLLKYERNCNHRFSKMFVVAEKDAISYRQLLDSSSIEVIPHGVDIEKYTPSPECSRNKQEIVISGNMFYKPNVDGVHWFYREVFRPYIRDRLPDATLVIVGARPAHSIVRLGREPGVTVMGSVPDVRPYLHRAAISVCPVRLAIGTQTKILEALACGTPVVTTSAGNHGIGALDGEHLYVADSAPMFAERVISLLRGEGWNRFSLMGRHFVQENFSWEKSSRILEDKLRGVSRPIHVSQSSFLENV